MSNRDQMIGRQEDRDTIVACIANAECVSIIGISNIGKSTLCRSLAVSQSEPEQQREGGEQSLPLFVYVDLNLMLQMTEQGFYEIVVRNLRLALRARGMGDSVLSSIDQSYDSLIDPRSALVIPLAFGEIIQTLCDADSPLVVLVLDEFDDVLANLDPRVFVRLRALKDRHWRSLSYVTATGRPLPEIRCGREVGEFCELFVDRSYYLRPLARPKAIEFMRWYGAGVGLQAHAEDEDFVWHCAGGHPVLTEIVCRALVDARDALPVGSNVNYARVRDQLDGDANVRLECAKLWNDLTCDEQGAIMAQLGGEAHATIPAFLLQAGLVQAEGASSRLFSDLFAGFAQRQRLVRHDRTSGIRVDVEAGDVWVDGKPVPVLTELEYKLLLLLYGKLDKICDKYEIVKAVWGEEYMDDVDDSRIEKLVSRLRQKLEPDVAEPRYLTTVRGRGYRLVSAG